MKIGKPFNTLSKSDYEYYIGRHKKYTDFNTLGLYRSLLENDKLTTEEKIAVRELAHGYFRKTFDFLQLKDPVTYLRVSTLGMELTVADENQLWEDIRRNQQEIIKRKRLNHRNFGEYAKHNCGVDHCPMNGVMVKEGSWLVEWHMQFEGDKHRYALKVRAEQTKEQRRNRKRMIDEDAELE
ncbi:MAG: hypothetical protein WBB45_10065 [Cyclobacteriaceae bacterium]